MAQFDGKVALVTGAASGIGQKVAEFYAREGAKVTVSDVDVNGGKQTCELIKSRGSEALFVECDVVHPEACQSLVQRTVEAFGRLDFACNNAGIGGEQNFTADYSVEGWQKVVAINLSGVFYCLKYELQAMLQNGGGSIINMASILGKVGFAGAPAYVSAKHGVIGLTENAAIEYASRGVRINAVGPGFIHTTMTSTLEADKSVYEKLVSLHPMGRFGKSEEVAELVIWLSSEKASFVTGAYYPIDGGYLAS